MEICIDSNILIYSFNTDSKYYKKARNFIKKYISDDGLAITDISLIEFFQISTNNKIVENPLSAEEANKIIQDIFNDPRIKLLDTNIDVLQYVFETSQYYNITKYEIYDHIIANLCRFYNIKYFYTVNTKDFVKYDYLKVINPF